MKVKKSYCAALVRYLVCYLHHNSLLLRSFYCHISRPIAPWLQTIRSCPRRVQNNVEMRGKRPVKVAMTSERYEPSTAHSSYQVESFLRTYSISRMDDNHGGLQLATDRWRDINPMVNDSQLSAESFSQVFTNLRTRTWPIPHRLVLRGSPSQHSFSVSST